MRSLIFAVGYIASLALFIFVEFGGLIVADMVWRDQGAASGSVVVASTFLLTAGAMLLFYKNIDKYLMRGGI